MRVLCAFGGNLIWVSLLLLNLFFLPHYGENEDLNTERDNKYKARIKILVKALGADVFAKEVEEEWAHLKDGPSTLAEAEYQRVAHFFEESRYDRTIVDDASFQDQLTTNPRFGQWVKRNTRPHKVAGYMSVTLCFGPGRCSR